MDIGQRGLGETEVEGGLGSRWTCMAGNTEAVCWQVRGQDLLVTGLEGMRVEEPKLTLLLREKGETWRKHQ